jgi:multicomponent Na+:H+ antiporter subunit E
MINVLTLNIILAVAWAALTGEITLGALLVGFLFGSFALYLTRPLFPGSQLYFRRVWKWLKLIVLFLYELLVSSIQVVWDVLTPTHKSNPEIMSMPLDAKGEMQILLVTNLISLTPGTLSLDVTEDARRSTSMPCSPTTRTRSGVQIKEGMERWVIEAME